MSLSKWFNEVSKPPQDNDPIGILLNLVFMIFMSAFCAFILFPAFLMFLMLLFFPIWLLFTAPQAGVPACLVLILVLVLLSKLRKKQTDEQAMRFMRGRDLLTDPELRRRMEDPANAGRFPVFVFDDQQMQTDLDRDSTTEEPS